MRHAAAPPYFLAWLDRLQEEVEQNPEWNSTAEREHVLEQAREARKKLEGLRE